VAAAAERRRRLRRRPTNEGAMRHLIFALLLAAVLSSCGDIVIGPVDHSCPTKPYRGPDGSGCSVGRG